MKGDVQVPPPNIRTNPSKKGSYGQPGTTLSERKGAKGVAGEYEYKSGEGASPARRRAAPRRAAPCSRRGPVLPPYCSAVRLAPVR